MGGYATARGRRRKPLIIAVVVSLIFGLGTIVAPAVADTIGHGGVGGFAARVLGLGKTKAGKDHGIAETSQTWLERLNQVRALFGSPPVVEDAELTRTALLHAKYMSINKSVSHEEDSTKPGFTAEGDAAGRASNVGAGEVDWADYRFIDMWATAPFHTAAMLRPSLTKVGLGVVKDDQGSWGALNVTTGIDWGKHPTTGWPRVFPTGSGVPYTKYWGSEWPDPTVACGGGDKTDFGLPIIVDFGGDVYHPTAVTRASAQLQGPDGPIDVCVTLSKDHGGTDWPLGSTQVLIMPRKPLAMGASYTGSVDTDRGPATINFTTGTTPAPPTPMPEASSSASPSPSASPTPSPTSSPSASPSPSGSATPTPESTPTLPSPEPVKSDPTTAPTSKPSTVVQPSKPIVTQEPDLPSTTVTTTAVKDQTMLIMKTTTLQSIITTNQGSLSGLQATLLVRRPGGAWETVTTKVLTGTTTATFRYTRVSLGVEELMVRLTGGGSVPTTEGNVVTVRY